MNLAYNYQLIPDLRKVKDMERFIAGSYWENDVWNLNDPFWDDYSIGKKSFTSRRITFFEYPHLFRLEMKYYLATRLLRKTLNPSSLWSDYQFKQNAAIQLHHRDELCILHPAELEHSIRNDGVAVPLDDSKFHNIPPLHSAHLHFYRWG